MVPVVTYAWWRHYGDFQSTLEAVLECGGDTDTTGAIAGALAGATVGENGIPKSWLTGIVDWPRSVCLLHLVGDRLAQQQQTGQPLEPVSYCWPAVVPRNLLFLAVVLAHRTKSDPGPAHKKDICQTSAAVSFPATAAR